MRYTLVDINHWVLTRKREGQTSSAVPAAAQAPSSVVASSPMDPARQFLELVNAAGGVFHNDATFPGTRMVDAERERLEEAPAADPEPGDGDDAGPMWGEAEATENIYVRAGPSPASEYVCSIAHGECFNFTRAWDTPDHTYYELLDGRGWAEDDVVVISSPRIGVKPPEVSQAFATADYKGGWIQLGPRVCDIAWDPDDFP